MDIFAAEKGSAERRRLLIISALTLVYFLLWANPVFCATYYVRPDGGTNTQCTGKADAAYPGSGSLQACAFNNPMWAIGPNQGSGPLAGGDTLIIKQGSYEMGYTNGIVTGGCDGGGAYTYDCYMAPIPSGPDPAHPTLIYGEGYDSGCSAPPELWGTERAQTVINLRDSNNVEIKCLEITDHASCGNYGAIRSGVFDDCNRSSFPHGDYAENGIVAKNSSNVLLQDLNIHGLAERGLLAGGLHDWILRRVNINANGMAGWDSDVGHDGTESSNTGTMILDNVTIQYNGCTETYPQGNPANCIGQGDGGYGDGIGNYNTAGDYIIQDSNVSFNTQDGVDLLYHGLGGSLTVKRSWFEGNAGNQLKNTGSTVVENSVLIGNCDYFYNSSLRAPGAAFPDCRAGGDTLELNFNQSFVTIKNSTVTGRGVSLLLMEDANGNWDAPIGCTGIESMVLQNTIFMGNYKWEATGNPQDVILAYNGGNDGNGGGSCGPYGAYPFTLTTDHILTYNLNQAYEHCPDGEGNICQDPQLAGSPTNGQVTSVELLASSPVRDAAAVITGMSSLDFNYYDRGDSWDMGALEYGSVPEDEQPPEPTCAEDPEYCSSESECEDNGYYWYGSDCHAEAPTCADGIEYCTTQALCEAQGYYWFNNGCHSTPATCADGIQYCTTEVGCESNGYYWYNESCHVEAPTCADGIEYCTTQVDCEGQGYYWYNGDCHSTPATCADGIEYCTTQVDCEKQGYYWYNGDCHSTPATCADGIEYCTTQVDCEGQGYYWYDGTCNAEPEPEPTCADGIEYCTTQVDCEGQGYYWYDDTCNAEPEPEPTCADGIEYCTIQVDCEGQGYYWYDGTCNAEPEPEPTCADGIEYCTTQVDCEGQGYYWYDLDCHATQQTTTGGGDDDSVTDAGQTVDNSSGSSGGGGSAGGGGGGGAGGGSGGDSGTDFSDSGAGSMDTTSDTNVLTQTAAGAQDSVASQTIGGSGKSLGSASVPATKAVESSTEWKPQSTVAMMRKSDQEDIPALMRVRPVPSIGDLEPSVVKAQGQERSLNFFERCVSWWRRLLSGVLQWFRRD